MEGITDFIKENARGIAIGAALMGGFMYLVHLGQTASSAAPDETQHPQMRREFAWRPSGGLPGIRPWHPGAPRNPSECVARGGVDMGNYCHGWH